MVRLKKAAYWLLFTFFASFFVEVSVAVFAEPKSWIEVTRFVGSGMVVTTEPFTVDHVDWRIRWAYEPEPEVPDSHPSLQVYVYNQESPGSWFESIRKNGTQETTGTLYISGKKGTFHLTILSAVQNYTLIIEQNVDSVSEVNSIRFSSGVTILSPLNRTYNSKFLTLDINYGAGLGLSHSLNYSIDGKHEGAIPLVAKYPEELHVVNQATGNVELPELSDGAHNLTVHVLCGLYNYHGVNPPGAPFKPTYPGSSDYEAYWENTVYFTISTGQENVIPEFPAWTPTLITLTAMVAALFVYKRKMQKTVK